MSQETKWSQFGTLITVFFFWGFVAASNDILIPVFKESLHLSQVQSQMVSFAFYVAYTVGSLIYVALSGTRGDLLSRIGYKNGIAVGLIVSAIGTLLFYPAAQLASFPLFISGLFVVGLGFSLQQTAANTLAVVMGDPKTGSQRLSLAGGINNFGTTIGPLIVSIAIFGSVTGASTKADIQSIKTPYLILGLAFLIVALIFKLSKVPNKVNLATADEQLQGEAGTGEDIALGKKDLFPSPKSVRTSALQYPQLVMGMVAIFVYVGVEVSTASNLPEFMKKHLGTPTESIAPYVSLYWASMMIGRWTASLGAFNLAKGTRSVLRFLMPYIAFGVFILVNKLANHDVTPFYVYAIIILAIIAGDILSKGNPASQLLIFSCMGIIALLVGMLADGYVSVYAFISVGLCCSILWPAIYTLAIAGLGQHTNSGGTYLIMMIMGGGIISLLQGAVSDYVIGIQYSYIVGVACFAYLAYYAIRVKSILKAQGIDYDVKVSGGGH
ncbi:MAG: MFS transporter [Chitinophagaceae bacterium]|nr:MAG: MFS transporter [Chitinophagaceae bacterium]